MLWTVLDICFYISLVFTVVYGGFGLMLYIMQSKFLYCPTKDVSYTPEELGLGFEQVSFVTDDGLRLTAWYVPCSGSDTTVLFCHGNGGNIMHRLDSINVFYELGLSCFIFDYRGYGQSQGKPTEKGTYGDAMAAYRWLTEHKKASPEQIIIFGRSLGGTIAAELATKVQAKALVVESAFTSYVDIGKKFYWYMPVRLFAKYSYRTIDYIGKVRCPVMIVHSRDDEIIPFEFGQQLYEAADEPKEFVDICGGHNDGFLVCGEVYRRAWLSWLAFLRKYESQVG